jgi:23S rRNA (pseudouridine1915-N3)-methyltransferase
VNIILLAVGKLRPYYRGAVDDYARRLQRYTKFNEYEVREASRAPTVDAQLSEEAGRLGTRISDNATLVALTRDGAGWSSTDLARQLERWALAARPLLLVIGGSHGIHPSLLTRASSRWSLGPLTLPHELARLVVVEQLYRGFTILKGEPYHKGSRV